MLLDTHLCLWLIGDPDRIGVQTRASLAGAPRLMFSSVSVAEIEIKRLIGRPSAPDPG